MDKDVDVVIGWLCACMACFTVGVVVGLLVNF